MSTLTEIRRREGRTGPAPAPRILVVDDDEDVRRGLAFALGTGRGWEVRTAADGFEAGYQVARFRPHLVLLDLAMPGMDGFTVCRRLRELSEGRDLRIVILTGYGSRGNGERSLIYGADLFLRKPVDLDELLAYLDELLQV